MGSNPIGGTRVCINSNYHENSAILNYMSKVKYTKEILERAAKEADSLMHLIDIIGARPSGGLSSHLSKKLKFYGIDTSHFTFTKRNASKSGLSKKSASEILVIIENPLAPRVKTYLLTRALLEIGIKYMCANCEISDWMGKPITLDVDHIDGNYLNNLKENLRFLCPNCHRQTPTFGRGKEKYSPEQIAKRACSCGNPKQPTAKQCASCYARRCEENVHKKNFCLDCDEQILVTSLRCPKHYHALAKGKRKAPEANKIIWPDAEILIDKLSNSNYTKLSKELGVSDNAIRKHLKSFGYDPKTLVKIT